MRNIVIQLFLLLFIVVAVSSCCHAYHVALHNYSDTAKTVKVTNFYRNSLSNKKAVLIADNLGVNRLTRHSQKELPVIVNNIEHSYSFILEKGKRAILEAGLGGPLPDWKIIIDGRDTIPMAGGDRRTIVKDNRWSNYTLYTTKIR